MIKKIIRKIGFFSGALLIAGMVTQFVTQKNVQAYQSNPIQSDSSPASHAEYQHVFNEDGGTHEVGDVVVWASTATNGTTGLSISTTVTEGDPLVAGVVVENDIPANSWGKIQTRGYNAAVNITGNCLVAGDLITSTTGEVAQASATVANEFVSGIFAVSLTADTDGSCRAILK